MSSKGSSPYPPLIKSDGKGIKRPYSWPATPGSFIPGGALPLREIPLFKPTYDEFKDEIKYLTSEEIQKAGRKFGVIKIQTPLEWVPQDDESQKKLRASLESALPILVQHFVPHDKTQQSFSIERGMARQLTLQQYQAETLRKDNELEATLRKTPKFKNLVGVLKEREMDEKALEKETPEQKRRRESKVREKYFKTRVIQESTMYGADFSGSAMRTDLECWNFSSKDFPCLTKDLDEETIAQECGYVSMDGVKTLDGVKLPYLYIGSYGSTFACHTEDGDCYSANYLHDGDPKVWFGVPCYASEAFEAVARQLIPKGDDFPQCPAFLREKSTLIHPDLLLARGIPVFTTHQRPGDLVITFPYAYHWGFNSGHNLAEARNVTTKDWIPFGLAAKKCKCHPDPFPVEYVHEIAKKHDPKSARVFEIARDDNRPFPRPKLDVIPSEEYAAVEESEPKAGKLKSILKPEKRSSN
ncbi:hypothetical protein RvY_14172 [Ramazzottius varieornatus]|uniref:JmjC domain-containing protein n=1 Tax=Ramazzottius varieornatus TaxID=947166 RepID=A0A1D1VU87_RAMVA|nr:hypothetical protein RvY_14172 [Ramazzottius varieornatus]